MDCNLFLSEIECRKKKIYEAMRLIHVLQTETNTNFTRIKSSQTFVPNSEASARDYLGIPS